jgi:hypothetical protein
MIYITRIDPLSSALAVGIGVRQHYSLVMVGTAFVCKQNLCNELSEFAT